MVGSLGIAAGVLFGDALTTWAGWQMIFWINVPIGVIAFCIAVLNLPKQPAGHAGLPQLDLPGGAPSSSAWARSSLASSPSPATVGRRRGPSLRSSPRPHCFGNARLTAEALLEWCRLGAVTRTRSAGS
jgi:MFS family permease